MNAARCIIRAALVGALLSALPIGDVRAQQAAQTNQLEPAVYDAGEEVVRLSNPAEPLQFTVVPQPAHAGVIPYGMSFPGQFGQPFSWQLLPEGLIYRSYLAGVREPRMSAVYFFDLDRDRWLLDATIGARIGVLRYGSETDIRPEGFQLDLEAAAFPRIDLETDLDMISTDFRYGIPLTWGRGPYQVKLAFYHLSSHIADEFLLVSPAFPRLNFSRDAILLGNSYYLTTDLRVYAEAGWAFQTDGGSEPWEFQFGIEYSPLLPTFGRGSPFVALNGHLREEVGFGGNFVAQFGWQWRGKFSERVLRLGVHYLTGPSPHYQFLRDSEEQLGLAVWYDY